MIPKQYKNHVPDNVTSYINGEFVSPKGAVALPIIYPGNGEQVSELFEADFQQVDDAVHAAKQSLDKGVWSNTSTVEKQKVFQNICALTAENLDELAALETINTGQTLSYSTHAQLPRVMASFKFYSEWIAQATEISAMQDSSVLRYATREPLGPVGLISSSNAPTALASTKIAAALAFGNSCVVKTSENTPLALARFMQILTEAGVPDGVVNLVNGTGPVTGMALSSHPLLRGISFTGGTATAKIITAETCKTLKRVELELGGKSANIIMPSCDLDLALDSALIAIYSNNGQQCFAGSRIILHRDIANEFMEKFCQRAQAIRVGDPFDSNTENGPLASTGHIARLQSYVDIARNEGAELLTGGKRPEHLQRGYYFEPTAVLAKSNSARVCQEEIFGPFATFLVVDSLNQAIDIANDSIYGLVSYIWSNNHREIMHASHSIKAGLVMANTPLTSLDLRMPFGGFKESGIGREGAMGARSFYTEEKTVAIALANPILPKLGGHKGE